MDDVTIKVRNTAERYGIVARVLHWSIGALIVAQLVLGFWTFEFMERTAARSANVNLHKALGVVLLILVLLRVAWRLHDPAPPLPASVGAQERVGARLGHVLLYILMVAMPVLGLLTSDTGGRPTDVFGLFTVPLMVGESEELHEFFESAHKVGAWALGILIVFHVAAAAMHRFVRKDGVTDRML
jgi:cytochrome b561